MSFQQLQVLSYGFNFLHTASGGTNFCFSSVYFVKFPLNSLAHSGAFGGKGAGGGIGGGEGVGGMVLRRSPLLLRLRSRAAFTGDPFLSSKLGRASLTATMATRASGTRSRIAMARQTEAPVHRDSVMDDSWGGPLGRTPARNECVCTCSAESAVARQLIRMHHSATHAAAKQHRRLPGEAS